MHFPFGQIFLVFCTNSSNSDAPQFKYDRIVPGRCGLHAEKKLEEVQCDFEMKIRPIVTILLHFIITYCLINFFYDFC